MDHAATPSRSSRSLARGLSASAALVAAVLVGLPAHPAHALTFTVDGQNFPGEATAEVDLSWDGVDTLTISIENTASFASASITGFVFDVPAAVTGLLAFTASGTADDDAWHELFPEPSNDPGNAPGGYRFEGGAGTGNNVAGGRPNDGILIGETGLFTFRFDGDALALAALVESDFLGEVDGASGPAAFGVRFQAIPTGEGSDFSIQSVPAPGAPILVAAGLALLALRRR